MSNKDSLGDRMKGYEQRDQFWLQRRIPVAIRVDMKAGHSFTKGFERPFDMVFVKAIQRTAKYMCENIQGAVLSYQQSDEITIILQDYKTLTTAAWFDYRTDKLCSIAASMATMAFNKYFCEESAEYLLEQKEKDKIVLGHPKSLCFTSISEDLQQRFEFYYKAADKGAMFDARCFNIPKEEVTNLIYWRQLDATRNSIQMVGQANFSHKELQNKSCNDIQDMLMTQKGINWNDFPTHLKRGSCCIKQEAGWIIDTEIPIFKNEGRDYIDNLIFIENEV